MRFCVSVILPTASPFASAYSFQSADGFLPSSLSKPSSCPRRPCSRASIDSAAEYPLAAPKSSAAASSSFFLAASPARLAYLATVVAASFATTEPRLNSSRATLAVSLSSARLTPVSLDCADILFWDVANLS